MLTFEISVNDDLVYVAGCELGARVFTLMAKDLPSDDMPPIAMSTDANTPHDIRLWLARELAVGDVVTIRITDSLNCDPPDLVLPKVKKAVVA